MSVIWVCSYPKSGNTWVRFLLDSYIQNKPSTSAGVEARIPSCSDWERKKNSYDERTTLVKTHYLPNAPRVLKAKTKKAIYIQRNPKDVLASAINFLHLTNYTKDSAETIAISFCKNFGLPVWKKVGYGSYLGHLYSWRHVGFPSLVVHYEKLKSDPLTQLKNMIVFLGLNYDEKRAEQAIINCEFEKLRALEREEKTNGKSLLGDIKLGDDSKYFFNKAGTSTSLDDIAPGLDDLFDQYFGKVMEDLQR